MSFLIIAISCISFAVKKDKFLLHCYIFCQTKCKDFSWCIIIHSENISAVWLPVIYYVQTKIQKISLLRNCQLVRIHCSYFLLLQVWSEVVTGGGAANFLTGIGGFLQNIIAGYGGFRLYKDRLSFNPTLPRNTTAIYFKDIDYLGSTLDFTVESEKISIELMKTISLSESAVTSLCVYCKRTGKQYALKLNAAIRLPRGRGVIMPSHMCTMKS